MLPSLWLTLVLTANTVTGVSPPTGLEQELIDDGADGVLNTVPFLDAALIASGVPDERVAAEVALAREALAPAIAQAKTQRDAAARGRVLLTALHDTVFRRYSETESTVSGVIHSGEFNCVSSAVLYVVAAEGLLEAPRGVVTPTHALARVTVDKRAIDVETTMAAGFDPDRAKLTFPHLSAAGAKAFVAEMAHAEELPALSLIAAIYSNRAVSAAARGDLNAAALAIDRASRLATGQLKERVAAWRSSLLNAGAVTLIDQGRLGDAQRLLELSLDGTKGADRTILTGNLAIVHVRLGQAAADRHDWAEALAHVTAAEQVGSTAGLAELKAKALAGLAALEGTGERCAALHSDEASMCFTELADTIVAKRPDTALQYARRALELSAKNLRAANALLLSLDVLVRAEIDAGHCDAVEAYAREGSPYRTATSGAPWQPEKLVGACWSQRAISAGNSGDWALAAQLHQRAGLSLGAEAVRHNLAAAEFNSGLGLCTKGNCDEARPFLRRAENDEAGLHDNVVASLAACAEHRGLAAFGAHDFASAAREFRGGLRDSPTDANLLTNLKSALNNLALARFRAGHCDEVRTLVPELAALHDDSALEAIKQHCP